MQIKFLQQNKAEELVLFFTGWGHSANTLSGIDLEEFDVLVAYNYTSKKADERLFQIIDSYKKTHLLAWSLGVFVANEYLQNISLTSAKAICGSPFPISNQYGIPEKVFAKTVENITLESFKKFTNRMCANEQAKKHYEQCLPQRVFNEQKKELLFLNQWIKETQEIKNCYSSAVISTDDKIFPLENMQRVWQKQLPQDKIKTITSAHFPFYLYKTISELIHL